MEFLHADWLKQILSWQKPNGCFGRMPETDFARNYKDRHNLDYQYAGDRADQEGDEQPSEENQQKPMVRTQPPRSIQADVEGYKTKGNRKGTVPVSNTVSYVDGESAVIQQSNKLQLVVTGNNQSLSSNRKDNDDVQKTRPRQVLNRSVSNTGVERHISQHINNNVNSDSRGRKQKQENLNNQHFQKLAFKNQQRTDTQKAYSNNIVNTGPKQARRAPYKSVFNWPVGGPAGRNDIDSMVGDKPVLRKLEIPVSDGGSDDQHQPREFMIRRLRGLQGQPDIHTGGQRERPHVGGMRRLLLERALTGNI